MSLGEKMRLTFKPPLKREFGERGGVDVYSTARPNVDSVTFTSLRKNERSERGQDGDHPKKHEAGVRHVGGVKWVYWKRSCAISGVYKGRKKSLFVKHTSCCEQRADIYPWKAVH